MNNLKIGQSELSGVCFQNYQVCFSCLMICFWLCWIFTAASAFLAVESGCYFLTVVLGLLLAVTSLVVEHGSRAPWLQHVGSRVAARRLNGSSACGIFPYQGSNPCLLHWQGDCLPPSHQEVLKLLRCGFSPICSSEGT